MANEYNDIQNNPFFLWLACLPKTASTRCWYTMTTLSSKLIDFEGFWPPHTSHGYFCFTMGYFDDVVQHLTRKMFLTMFPKKTKYRPNYVNYAPLLVGGRSSGKVQPFLLSSQSTDCASRQISFLSGKFDITIRRLHAGLPMKFRYQIDIIGIVWKWDFSKAV